MIWKGKWGGETRRTVNEKLGLYMYDRTIRCIRGRTALFVGCSVVYPTKAMTDLHTPLHSRGFLYLIY